MVSSVYIHLNKSLINFVNARMNNNNYDNSLELYSITGSSAVENVKLSKYLRNSKKTRLVLLGQEKLPKLFIEH